MTKTYTLRGLFLAAATALVLLPLVALGTGLVLVASANWSRFTLAGDEIDAAQVAVARAVAAHWAALDAPGFEADLTRLAGRSAVAIEVRALDDRVVYASPGVKDGVYSPGGLSVEPNQRVVLVRRGDETVGVVTLWIWPASAITGMNHTLLGGLSAAVATLIGLMLAVLAWIRRSILTPVQALSQATAAVATGSLDFAVPSSQVRELDGLGRAFGHMRDRLQASLARQQALETDRRRFLAAVGHDLRTPLSSVRAFAEGLRDGLAREPARAAHYGEVILNKTAEVERLVEDLFQLSRLDLPEAGARKQDVDAAEYLGAALRAFQPEAEGKQIHLEARGPLALPLQVDPDLFVRAINNLLSNALRHTPAGGTVRLTWAEGGPNGAVTITVADTGEGIPPEELPHLFSPMHRADRSRSRRSGGAGLGLAITARVVTLHGG
ncbi:MAG TPA: HAMP domain-containing sensor histidine kinase, partial [Symbiobacteriaceae bacterium]|nr:HAMP domain-containing sensor histidine kinase [Symbiobacteriaceae bacterium]